MRDIMWSLSYVNIYYIYLYVIYCICVLVNTHTHTHVTDMCVPVGR